MASLQAVFFDIDDTLCPTTEFARRARRNAVRAMVAAGLAEDEDRVAAELDEVIAEFSSNYEHHFDKLLLRLSPSALQGQNRAMIVAAGVVAYHDTKFRELRPFEGVTELLADLRRAGVRLGIITHGWTLKQAEKLVRLKLVRYFDDPALWSEPGSRDVYRFQSGPRAGELDERTSPYPDEWELYELDGDPAELTNLASSERHAEVFDQMRTILEEERARKRLVRNTPRPYATLDPLPAPETPWIDLAALPGFVPLLDYFVRAEDASS